MRLRGHRTPRPSSRSRRASGSGDRPCKLPPRRRVSAGYLPLGAEGGAFHGPARKAAVVVGGLDEFPALACLALDERLARFALGVQRVEFCSRPSSELLRV